MTGMRGPSVTVGTVDEHQLMPALTIHPWPTVTPSLTFVADDGTILARSPEGVDPRDWIVDLIARAEAGDRAKATGDEPPADAEWCDTCQAGITVVETSVETTGAMERERDWIVVRLACGHESSSPVA